ncbi:MAG TPA: hypothetical protein VEC37_01015 [Bacillota bacterium]|nr:hypothetical protein [Bacillota bacterium]
MSVKQVAEAVQNCKLNAEKLRSAANLELDNNIRKLFFEAAHHLDVGVAELEYVTTNATVSV